MQNNMNKRSYNAHITSVKPTNNFTLFVEFNDGVSGVVVFDVPRLTGVFEPLNNAAFFKSFNIEPYGAGVITWPNGVDLDTGWMYFTFKDGLMFHVAT